MGPLITCTATYLKQPIADHVAKLLAKDGDKVADIDDILSIVLLSVAMFEAYMVRARYLNLPKEKREIQPGSLKEKAVEGKEPSGREIMREICPKYGEKRLAEVDEVYVLRDVITHNHLWEYHKDGNGNKNVTRRLFGGNPNFKKNVDFDRRPIATRCLALPVVPGEQTRESARVSFDTLWSALKFASEHIPNLAQPENLTVNLHIELSRKLFAENAGHTVQLHRLVEALRHSGRRADEPQA